VLHRCGDAGAVLEHAGDVRHRRRERGDLGEAGGVVEHAGRVDRSDLLLPHRYTGDAVSLALVELLDLGDDTRDGDRVRALLRVGVGVLPRHGGRCGLVVPVDVRLNAVTEVQDWLEAVGAVRGDGEHDLPACGLRGNFRFFGNFG